MPDKRSQKKHADTRKRLLQIATHLMTANVVKGATPAAAESAVELAARVYEAADRRAAEIPHPLRYGPSSDYALDAFHCGTADLLDTAKRDAKEATGLYDETDVLPDKPGDPEKLTTASALTLSEFTEAGRKAWEALEDPEKLTTASAPTLPQEDSDAMAQRWVYGRRPVGGGGLDNRPVAYGAQPRWWPFEHFFDLQDAPAAKASAFWREVAYDEHGNRLPRYATDPKPTRAPEGSY